MSEKNQLKYFCRTYKVQILGKCLDPQFMKKEQGKQMELNIETITDDIIWTDLNASQRDTKPC